MYNENEMVPIQVIILNVIFPINPVMKLLLVKQKKKNKK